MLIAGLMVLMAKAEVTYATDPVPDATNALLASNIDITPVSSTVANRQKAHATFGNDPDQHTAIFSIMTFDVGMAGSGAAGTAPLYGPLLRACNMVETITAMAKVTYKLGVFNHATSKSVTIYFNEGGKQYALVGARGTVSIILGPNALPILRFSFTGIRQAATDTALESAETTLASWLDEIEVNEANTTASLFGITPAVQTFQLDLNNTITPRDRPNAKYVAITNAGPKGQIGFEMPTVATFDPETTAIAGTLGPLALQHGQDAGNIVKVSSTYMQLLQPKPQVTDGILHVQSNFAFVRNAGLDDTTITVQ
jgi:hypothetical protein